MDSANRFHSPRDSACFAGSTAAVTFECLLVGLLMSTSNIEPLFMRRSIRSSTFRSTISAVQSQLPLERRNQNAALPVPKYPVLRNITLFSGGGGLVSTAGDYMRFGEMLRAGGALDGGAHSVAKVDQMMTTNRSAARPARQGPRALNHQTITKLNSRNCRRLRISNSDGRRTANYLVLVRVRFRAFRTSDSRIRTPRHRGSAPTRTSTTARPPNRRQSVQVRCCAPDSTTHW